MVEKQKDPLPATTSILGKPNFTLRDKVFQHSLSLIDDVINSTCNILVENGIHTIFNILNISFKDIENIKDIIDKKRIQLSLANTNRLKVLKSFHMHNDLTQ